MTPERQPSDAALESYLAELGRELHGLPSAERNDILLETRSHVLDQLARSPQRNASDIVADLGAPEDYALRFLTERSSAHEPETALIRIARLSAAGPKGAAVLLVVLIGYAIAFIALGIALWKVLAPDQVGYWVHYTGGVRHRFVGVTDIPQQGREILGYWSAIIPAAVAVLLHLALSALIRSVTPRVVERKRS